MGIIVWLIVGGVVGWLASIIMRTDAQQGLLLNIVVGIVGALLAGFIISPSWASARSTKASASRPSLCRWAERSFCSQS